MNGKNFKSIESLLTDTFYRFEKYPDKILYYRMTDSTNERARLFPEGDSPDIEISLGCDSGVSLFIADCQTAGRGRRGRSFVSNNKSGLYMSFRFTLDIPLSEAVAITPFAAVAASRAIERLCGARCDIKWVNDLYLNNKKLAGILTESVSCEAGTAFICGIGINIKGSELPAEVAKIATSLEEEGYTAERLSLAAAIADEFIRGFSDPWAKDILREYKERSFLIGKTVTVLCASGDYSATVTDITDRFELEVECNNSVRKRLSTGEVSLKLTTLVDFLR